VDPEQVVDEFEARLERSAFGQATRASYLRESAEEDAHFTAARNLLEKAARRLAAGNDDGAAALARRALAIQPTLEHEALPAAMAAQMLVYTELVDRREAAGGGSGDASWLGPVLDLFRQSAGPVRTEFARVLDALREAELAGDEERRLHGVVPVGARLEDPLSGVPEDGERVDVLLGMLRLLADLHLA
jgi:hypothetical protein